MSKWYRILRYDWPLHFVLLFTNWLPDTIVFLRLRGFLASFFFKQCGCNLRLGRNVSFVSPAHTKIGDDVYVAYGCWILGLAEICIESEVMFGPYCVLSDGNHTFTNGSYRFGTPISGRIVVGSGSWIGAHTVILMNVTIGKGVLVAANSVVNKDVDDFKTVGGVPSKELNSSTK